MKESSKQLEELATGLKHNLFLKARLKLTALYVIIIAAILIGFSFFLYKDITANLKDVSEEDFTSIQAEQRYVSSAVDNVKDKLLFSDLAILIITSILSYILAGKTLKPIQETMEKQKRFASDASHELRTPLAIMKTENEVALRGGLLTKESAQIIIKSNLEEIQKMTQMVNDLLLIARSVDKNIQPITNILDVSSITREVSEKILKLAKEKEISINIVGEVKINIKGNRTLLERVFMNIFQNSIQHTMPGGSIIISLNNNDKNAVIKIKDTGEGIDEKHLPFVFDRFYKADSSRNDSKNGSGLGLSIVKEIVDNHGGTIKIESKKDKGTSITITFPLVV